MAPSLLWDCHSLAHEGLGQHSLARQGARTRSAAEVRGTTRIIGGAQGRVKEAVGSLAVRAPPRRRSYQRDISSMASHAAEQLTSSETRAGAQPQRSTIHANAVGDAALTIRTGVAMRPSTAP